MSYTRAFVRFASLMVHGNLTLCQERRKLRQDVRQLGVASAVSGARPEGDLPAGGDLTAELLDYFPARGGAESIVARTGIYVYRVDLCAFSTQALHAPTHTLRKSRSCLVTLLGYDDPIVCAQRVACGPCRG